MAVLTSVDKTIWNLQEKRTWDVTKINYTSQPYITAFTGLRELLGNLGAYSITKGVDIFA